MTAALAGTQREMLFADSAERRQAIDLLRELGNQSSGLAFEAHAERRVPLPAELSLILARVLEVLASGGTVTIRSLPQELTTTLAAELLGISRPTLMKLIRSGEMPARKVGSHHRLKLVDVIAIKRARLQRQALVFNELRDLEDQIAHIDGDPR